jgi:predicted Zn-dependent peptidase
MTYLSCAPEQVGDGLARVRAVCDAVNRDGVTAAEIEQARSKAMSRIVLRSERPMGRLAALGSNWLYRGEYLRVDEELAAYQSVTPAVIRALLEAYPLLGTTTVGVGPCAEL